PCGTCSRAQRLALRLRPPVVDLVAVEREHAVAGELIDQRLELPGCEVTSQVRLDVPLQSLALRRAPVAHPLQAVDDPGESVRRVGPARRAGRGADGLW